MVVCLPFAVLPQEILEKLVDLMMDPFGNYLIQKLLDRCSEEQRLQVGGRTGRGGGWSWPLQSDGRGGPV